MNIGDRGKMGRKFYTDGAGWNNKKSRTCVYYPGISGPVVKTFYQKYSNNQCEYFAVIDALKAANEGDIIYTDSLLVVNQLKGEFRVKAKHLRPLFMEARSLKNSKKVEVCWLSRKENLAGIHLEKTK